MYIFIFYIFSYFYIYIYIVYFIYLYILYILYILYAYGFGSIDWTESIGFIQVLEAIELCCAYLAQRCARSRGGAMARDGRGSIYSFDCFDIWIERIGFIQLIRMNRAFWQNRLTLLFREYFRSINNNDILSSKVTKPPFSGCSNTMGASNFLSHTHFFTFSG